MMYTEIIPPMLRVLAYSTATYFALQLTWSLLNRSEEKAEQSTTLGHLQRDVRAVAAPAPVTAPVGRTM